MFRYVALACVAAIAVATVGVATDPPAAQAPSAPPNPNIDMNGYLKVSQEAANHRQTHRVSEDDFILMSQAPATIILDARSKAKYDLLHIKGAINLNFSDITVDSLKKTIPDKN